MQFADVFTTLTKYKKPENRFTASFVYLLRYLWNNSDHRQREVLCNLLNQLCQVSFSLDIDINVVMQKTEKNKREDKKIPDFQIESGSTLVWIEVKDEASPKRDQLEKYKNELLRKEGYRQRSLVLLRHYYVSREETERVVNNDVTWDTLYTLLKEVEAKCIFNTKSVHFYLLQDFLRYLEGKGVTTLKMVSGKNVKEGLSDFVSLLTLVQTEARDMFREKGLNLNVSTTDIGFYEGEYVEFNFDEGNKKGRGYTVGLWGPEDNYPISVFLHAKGENLKELEGNRIVKSKVPKDDDNFFADEEGNVYVRRPLERVFTKTNVQDQRQEIGRLLRELYEEFKAVKEPVHTRRGKK